MIYEMLDRNMIFPDMYAKDMEDVMRQLGGALTEAGYAKDSYVDALIEREKEYPTGLNAEVFGVAIPHTPVEHILKTTIAIGVLHDPVEFVEMGSDDDKLAVSIIFMLCIAGKPGAHDHIDELQAVLSIIQDPETLKKIKDAKDAEKIMNIIKNKEDES